MAIYLGNIQFDEVEQYYGYRLSEEDKILWEKYHNNDASLEGMESCFHCFDIPRCITVKGEGAKEALLKMFTKDKLVCPKGLIQVYEVKD